MTAPAPNRADRARALLVPGADASLPPAPPACGRRDPLPHELLLMVVNEHRRSHGLVTLVNAFDLNLHETYIGLNLLNEPEYRRRALNRLVQYWAERDAVTKPQPQGGRHAP